jgi:hypothetical protein
MKIDVTAQLESIVNADDFTRASHEVTEAWQAANCGREIIEPILRFMEAHPNLDYGTPGPIVHLIENVRADNYGDLLLASLQRQPTDHTAWMLNRVLNATREPPVRAKYIAAMQEAARFPGLPSDVRERLNGFVGRAKLLR